MKKFLFISLLLPFLICWKGEEPEQIFPAKNENASISSNRARDEAPFFEPIHVSYFIIPPHVFLDEEENVRGVIYDLIERYIAPEIGIKFQWEKHPTSVQRQIINLKNCDNYISSFLVFAQERCKFLIFSKKPYYFAHPIIAVPKSNPIEEVRNVGDINHMVFGYHTKGFLTPFMKDPSIKFDFIQSTNFLELNLKKAIAHRIDGIYSPGKASTIFYLQKFGMTNEFKILDLPEKHTPVCIAFPKKLKKLADRYDQAFERLDGQQLYLKLLSQYIDVSELERGSERP